MSTTNIAKCQSCGQEMRPNDYHDRLRAINAELLEALHHVAITDDADCRIASDAKAMTKIARAALAKAGAK